MRSRNAGEPLSDQAAATIWNWLVVRNDVSVGPGRKYNELPLQKLQQSSSIRAHVPMPSKGERVISSRQVDFESASDNPDLALSSAVHVFVSGNTMWEMITGHSVNYKRVPRLEWVLLLGIASTKSQGILQGDLGRLVGQDKRSVPKRTDSLLKKSYIVKRTTLVRGTKTSKLWLKTFAPPFPKESDNPTLESEAEMNMSSQTLTASLDQVPWHTRWTGDSMDFHALATTIMAVTKEWQVIRLQDLKAKLGVLCLRWQMKIVSKICRFLNSCGAIQYVAAKLDNKVYKDCIRFNRDLSAKDWSAFLATGKRSAKPMKTALSGMAERADAEWQIDVSQVNGARLGECPPWSIDDPLPQKIAKSAQSFGTIGLTNPEIYVLTLGPTFNRYISSLTSCMATSNVQPGELKHLQLKSEHIRVGKVASYRFYTPQILPTGTLTQMEENLEASTISMYGFSPGPCKPRFSGTDVTLSDICGLAKSRNTGQFGAKRQKRAKKQPESRLTSAEPEVLLPKPQSIAKIKLLITLRVSAKALRNIMSSDKPVMNAKSPSSYLFQSSERAGSPEASLSNTPTSFKDSSNCISRRGSARGRGRGRGRPPQSTSNADVSSSRPWTCEKCGGSWKNDLGLKYHLEKSRTSCNPEFASMIQESGPRGKFPALFSRRAQDSVNAEIADKSPRTKCSDLNRKSQERAVAIPETKLRYQKAEQKSIHNPLSLDQNSATERANPKNPLSPSIGFVKSWRRSTAVINEPVKSSHPKIDQGLLSSRAIKPQRQGSILQDRLRSETSAAGDIPPLRSAGRSMNEIETSAVSSFTSQFAGETNNSRDDTELIDISPNQVDSQNQGHRAISKSDSILTPNYKSRLSRTKSGNSHTELRLLIQRLLNEQHGVIIGGKPLWDSIIASWNTQFAEKTTPVKAQFQSTVNSLLKDGVVMEHWHAFRDSSGSFSKCQLLTLPGIDAFSAQSLDILEKLKRPLPSRGEIVLGSDTNAGSSEPKIGGRGRRALAREVAILHAPVYAAQVAAKKDQESENRDRVKRQRHSEARDSIEDVASIPPKKRPKVYQFASSGSQLDFSRSHDGLPQELRKTAPSFRLHFLEPNNFLGQDAPDIEVPQNLPFDNEQNTVQEEDPSQETTRANSIPVNLCDSIGHCTGNESCHDHVTVLYGCNGTWPSLDTQYFERASGSFTIRGWMPDTKWLGWENFSQNLEKRLGHGDAKLACVNGSGAERNQRFMNKVRACFDMEMKLPSSSVNTMSKPAGPHNIFVRFNSDIVNTEASSFKLVWPADGQLNERSDDIIPEATEYTSSSSDDELDWRASPLVGNVHLKAHPAGHGETTSHGKAKRVALVTRALTSLHGSQLENTVNDDVEQEDYPFDSPDELMAAFVAVRTLMGGADKSIDWGLLMFIFPDAGLKNLRRFWDNCRRQQGPHISAFTRAFQERYIIALQHGNVAMIDFNNPQDYDWARIIRWTMGIPRQEGFEIPCSRKLLKERFSLTDIKTANDDWRERFFHVQASIFARFEAVTSIPAALSIDDLGDRTQHPSRATDLDIARSWVKSLCGTGDCKYSVENIRDKFFTLLPGNKRRTSAIFKEAIDQLTKQRIICKIKKPPLGSRPYRLNEGYLATLSKLAQSAKYDDAARFKTILDLAFRKEKRLTIPYSLSDGAMMALTNLSAAGRIRLVPTNLPYIPFGFEPGNYESRKYPKSYYHFGLEAVPTETYLFHEQIDVLRAASTTGPPLSGQCGELPQWVDVFGEPNETRWSEVLGAFCFAMATRGSMDIEGICSALNPVLDRFEAGLIVHWGKQTGVLTDFSNGLGSVLGEWWWLVVPWIRRR